MAVHATHSYDAKPIGWLLIVRPLSMHYQGDLPAGAGSCSGADTCVSSVLAIGTPALWWGGVIALVAAVILWVGVRDWRFGIPVSAFVLVLMAIPMSFVNPRAGRSINLLIALLTYIVYSNLLSVSVARVSQGRMDFTLGSWLVHAAMVLLLVFMFAQRMQIIRLRLAR